MVAGQNMQPVITLLGKFPKVLEHLFVGICNPGCHGFHLIDCAAQFIAYSSGGSEYPAAHFPPPAPELKGRVCAGNLFEGWVLFQVAKDDKKPVAMFAAGVGGYEAIEHGGNIWFRLY